MGLSSHHLRLAHQPGWGILDWHKVTSGLEKLLAAEETPAGMAEWREVCRQAIYELIELAAEIPKERRKFGVRSRTTAAPRDFLTIPEIAERWRIARPTVYNRLRAADVKVLDFAQRGGRGRKVVPMGEILRIEGQQLKRL